MSEKTDLYEMLATKVTILEDCLFTKENFEVKVSDFSKIEHAIVFLRDHKYRLTEQGLNQIESIILDAEKKFKNISKKA